MNFATKTMQASNRRRVFRFDLKLPCRVFSPYHTFEECTGVTENISRTGVRIRINDVAPGKRLPQVGNSARIVINLPASGAFSQKYLDCEATVVRAEAGPGDCRDLGLRVRRMQFRDPGSMSRILSIAGGDEEPVKLTP